MTSNAKNLVAAAIDNAEDIRGQARPEFDEESAIERATDRAIDAEYGAQSRESQATSIVRLVTASGAQLWHTPAGDAYITIPVASHHEHYQLSSRGCRDYLTRLFYRDAGKAPSE